MSHIRRKFTASRITLIIPSVQPVSLPREKILLQWMGWLFWAAVLIKTKFWAARYGWSANHSTAVSHSTSCHEMFPQLHLLSMMPTDEKYLYTSKNSKLKL
jgi:hypothetical protein